MVHISLLSFRMHSNVQSIRHEWADQFICFIILSSNFPSVLFSFLWICVSRLFTNNYVQVFFFPTSNLLLFFSVSSQGGNLTKKVKDQMEAEINPQKKTLRLFISPNKYYRLIFIAPTTTETKENIWCSIVGLPPASPPNIYWGILLLLYFYGSK